MWDVVGFWGREELVMGMEEEYYDWFEEKFLVELNFLEGLAKLGKSVFFFYSDDL